MRGFSHGAAPCGVRKQFMDDNLHSPQRHLIELRMAHADLDSVIDRVSGESSLDELAMRRLKKRRLVLKDQISRLEAELEPREPA